MMEDDYSDQPDGQYGQYGQGNNFNKGRGGGGGYSPGTEGSPKKVRANQSLIPTTIRQLNEAPYSQPEDKFRIDGKEADQVTFIALIRSVTENPSNYNYLVEDGTGGIEIREWVSKSENEYAAQKRAERRQERREGVYVRVVGMLKNFSERRYVLAFSIRPIQDFNEITHHFLETIFAHLYNTKGPQNHQGIKNENMAQHHQQQQSNGGGQNAYHDQNNENSFTPIQEHIMHILSNCTSEHGLHIKSIAQQIGGAASFKEVKSAIDWLFAEGHIYSSKDDEHFAIPSNY